LHIALRLRAPEQVLLTLIDTYNPEEAEEIEEAEALLSKTHRSLPEFESEFEAEAEAESEAGQGGERQHRHVPQPLVEGGDAPAAAGGGVASVDSTFLPPGAEPSTIRLSDAQGLLTAHVAHGGGVLDSVAEEEDDGIIFDPGLRSLVEEFGGRAALITLANESEDPTLLKLATETLSMLEADKRQQRRMPTREALSAVSSLRRSLNFVHAQADLAAQYERDAEEGRIQAAKQAEAKAAKRLKSEIVEAVVAEQSSRRIGRLQARHAREKAAAKKVIAKQNRIDSKTMSNLPESGGREVPSMSPAHALSTSAYVRKSRRTVDPVELLAASWGPADSVTSSSLNSRLASQPSQQDVRELMRVGRRAKQLAPVVLPELAEPKKKKRRKGKRKKVGKRKKPE